LLHALIISGDSKTVGEIKKDFSNTFKINLPNLLNQHFGIIRLIPLLLIREELKTEDRKYDPRISIIRHALAHGNFSISETGYKFCSDKGDCIMTYSELVDFIWLVENEFYIRE
jgi:hypothetical protein